MIWTATIAGQPPSLNDLYVIATRYAKGGRQYKGIGKNPDAVQYHKDAVTQLGPAIPSRWAPKGQVRVRISLYLMRDIDADNTLKVLMDALQDATGVNDRNFLPCIESKIVGVAFHYARVELWIEDIES